MSLSTAWWELALASFLHYYYDIKVGNNFMASLDSDLRVGPLVE